MIPRVFSLKKKSLSEVQTEILVCYIYIIYIHEVFHHI